MSYNAKNDEYRIWFVPDSPVERWKLVGVFTDFIEAVWFRDNVDLTLEYRNAY